MRIVLFNLFINYLKLRLSNIVAKFANDTKLFRIVKYKADCEELQENISKLGR